MVEPTIKLSAMELAAVAFVPAALHHGGGLRPASTLAHANIGAGTRWGFLLVEAEAPPATGPQHRLEVIVRGSDGNVAASLVHAGGRSRELIKLAGPDVRVAFWPMSASEGWKNVRVWIEHA